MLVLTINLIWQILPILHASGYVLSVFQCGQIFQAYPGADPKAFAKFCPHLLQFIVLPALHALIGYRIYQRSNWLALFGDDDIAVAVMNAT